MKILDVPQSQSFGGTWDPSTAHSVDIEHAGYVDLAPIVEAHNWQPPFDVPQSWQTGGARITLYCSHCGEIRRSVVPE